MAVFRKPPYDPAQNPYPKWLYPEGMKPFIVQNKEEHDAFLASQPKPEAKPEAEVSEKDALVAKAEGLGIEVDKRWGVERIKSEIAQKERE